MGVFEFVLLLVLITTIGKIISQRQERRALRQPPAGSDEILQLNESITELSARLQKLEEERDFYRALLDPPPEGKAALPPREGEDPR